MKQSSSSVFMVNVTSSSACEGRWSRDGWNIWEAYGQELSEHLGKVLRTVVMHSNLEGVVSSQEPV